MTRFRAGDRVVAFTSLRMGTYAEFACVAESGLIVALPPGIDFPAAAALPYGGMIALHFLRHAGLAAGQEVLVYGASGAIGSSALQIAIHAGARVTAVCGPDNHALVTSLGAVATLDYTTTDTPGDARFDLVFDAVGKRRTSALKTACEGALKPGGRAISVDGGMPKMTLSALTELVDLAGRGELTPVVDRSYPLERIAEAHAYVEERHKRGNVVVLP